MKIIFPLVVLIFIDLTYPENLNAIESTFSYDELLNQAERNIRELRHPKAIEKLNIAATLVKTPESRFYFLNGEANLGIGQEDEALRNFKQSIDLNPKQPDVLLRLVAMYDKLNKPVNAFHNLKLYLAIFPDNREGMYRALVLSARTGNEAFRKYILNRFRTTNIYKNDRAAVISVIEKLLSEKKYPEAKKECRKYLLYFPEEESLHNFLFVAQKNIHESEVENILIDTASIFRFNPKFTISYGMYLFEKNRYFEALSTLRRAFLVSLLVNKFNADEEILFFIRQTYYEMRMESDAGAAGSLIETMSKRENQDLQNLDSLIKLYSNNREYILFTIFYLSATGKKDLKEYNYYQELLTKRDEKMSEKEMINIRGAFSFEDLTLDETITDQN
ncbi:MAG: hypothetical protein K8R21_16485 [Leptospira sp.]|nr:hypothetical protein [Leptospira sp.]